MTQFDTGINDVGLLVVSNSTRGMDSAVYLCGYGNVYLIKKEGSYFGEGKEPSGIVSVYKKGYGSNIIIHNATSSSYVISYTLFSN